MGSALNPVTSDRACMMPQIPRNAASSFGCFPVALHDSRADMHPATSGAGDMFLRSVVSCGMLRGLVRVGRRSPNALHGDGNMPRVIHFEISADEPERAARFYADVFGWEVTKWDGP